MAKVGLGVLAAAMWVLVGCGPPALTCQTQTCSTGNGKTYQLCVNVNASETWKFGGMSCQAATSDSTAVMSCTNEVAAYCGGGGGGGTGGTGGGGGGGTTACTYTVSGAQTASGTCMAQGGYASGNPGVAVTIDDGSTFAFAATISGQTTLTAGTYGTADAVPGYGGTYVVGTMGAYDLCSTNQNCSDTSGNTIPPQGSFTLQITDPGTMESAGGGTLWPSPQGTLSVTMPAQPGGSESGTVVVTVTL